jgi:hypothetical protein
VEKEGGDSRSGVGRNPYNIARPDFLNGSTPASARVTADALNALGRAGDAAAVRARYGVQC